MSDFEISGEGKDIVLTHKVHGHVYQFEVVPDQPPRISGTVNVRLNDRAAHDAGEFFDPACREAESVARQRGFAVK
jgi:hypothetical protein